MPRMIKTDHPAGKFQTPAIVLISAEFLTTAASTDYSLYRMALKVKLACFIVCTDGSVGQFWKRV